uniref:DNA methylase n=1 Tax=Candidatus Kentrum sp. TC TaxID=2126339 RepID=A0A450YLH0_9GAMM|nr:MAG: hypothetical protein BECKTC1821E_GA0114239_101841 [Candidatus Kentron sp. TC]
MENNASPGQAIYEPFSGSGTSLIAAETCGRVCLALEIRKKGRYPFLSQRREGDLETWLDAGMTMGLETTPTNQPCGARLEFRVVAVNKAGDGEPSNGVLATL